MNKDFNTIMIVFLIVVCFIILLKNNSDINNRNTNNRNINNSDNNNISSNISNNINNNQQSIEQFYSGHDSLNNQNMENQLETNASVNNSTNDNKQEESDNLNSALPSEKQGLTPIKDNINLYINVVTIAKDYNGIQVSFKKKNLNNIKYYLHVYRLDKEGNELSGEGSYLLVGLDPKQDKNMKERLISNPIPIKHPKAHKFIVALQYTYTDETGQVNESGYEFPSNLVNQNKIFTLNKPIEDQVAEYKNFEKYLDQKQEIEKAEMIKKDEENKLISNADGSFSLDQLRKSLGGFPDSLFLDRNSVSSLDDLINRNLKMGILNVNAHVKQNVYEEV